MTVLENGRPRHAAVFADHHAQHADIGRPHRFIVWRKPRRQLLVKRDRRYVFGFGTWVRRGSLIRWIGRRGLGGATRRSRENEEFRSDKAHVREDGPVHVGQTADQVHGPLKTSASRISAVRLERSLCRVELTLRD